jgi:hypothetical protein
MPEDERGWQELPNGIRPFRRQGVLSGESAHQRG